ncbi:hypothetical protein DBZ36_05955 [Alginatibacterium sediminis]|uniref:Uncharacterized protein n=1 Tax=Alginatibacterium sediminis TaxID=2164068 RepID=A0A420EH57_9ALTE|nr:hypothetical protein [Alginatibacterium sediminis]RKF19994.1 hypothetical protein DBZ36_05955 [Alginatibacterium sediminis]
MRNIFSIVVATSIAVASLILGFLITVPVLVLTFIYALVVNRRTSDSSEGVTIEGCYQEVKTPAD